MFNEAAGCIECIEKVSQEIAAISDQSRILVVNDGSTDKTLALLASQAGIVRKLNIISHPKNLGYGAAINSGVQYAIENRYQYVVFMDSDLTNDPKDITKFFLKMKEGYGVIKASRYSDGGGVEGVPFIRRMISLIGNFVARKLFRLPIADCTNGFRAINVDLLNQVVLKETGFSIIMEELYLLKRKGASFCNVPVTLTFRNGNLRKSSFVYNLKIFYKYLKYPVKSFIKF